MVALSNYDKMTKLFLKFIYFPSYIEVWKVTKAIPILQELENCFPIQTVQVCSERVWMNWRAISSLWCPSLPIEFELIVCKLIKLSQEFRIWFLMCLFSCQNVDLMYTIRKETNFLPRKKGQAMRQNCSSNTEWWYQHSRISKQVLLQTNKGYNVAPSHSSTTHHRTWGLFLVQSLYGHGMSNSPMNRALTL